MKKQIVFHQYQNYSQRIHLDLGWYLEEEEKVKGDIPLRWKAANGHFTQWDK